jgi:hypothetical protein
MFLMSRWWLAVLLLALHGGGLAWGRQRTAGWCELGNSTINVMGYTSSVATPVQASGPNCLVAVYKTGSTPYTLATIYSDNLGTALANPFNAGTNGYWFFYADDGEYDVQFGAPFSPTFTLGDFSSSDLQFCQPGNGVPCTGQAVSRSLKVKVAQDNVDVIDYGANGNGIADSTAAFNAAYTALPATGGSIFVPPGNYVISTGINFSTNHKPVLLYGSPGGASTLTCTNTAGTCITLEYGTDLVMGKGIRDLTLTGPGHTTTSVGVQIGVTNGAQGTTISNSKIQSFGTDIQFGSNTWIVKLDHLMVRDATHAVIFPTSCTGCGENIEWDHVTFADQPTASANNYVWLQAGEHKMVACSFDQAQLTIGNGSSAPGAIVTLTSPHFENPNYVAQPGFYDFIVIGSHVANHLNMMGASFNQDCLTAGSCPGWAPAPEYILQGGGVVNLYATELFSPIGPITNLVTANGLANINVFHVNDLSGQIGHIVGGTSTGYITQIPGAAGNQTTGFNNVIGINAGTNRGGATLDVTGSIKASYASSVAGSGQITSLAPIGTTPFVVNSTTPVVNLFSNYILFDESLGTPTVTFTTHIVMGQFTLTSGSQTINLTPTAAQFTNSSTYACMTEDNANLANTRVTYVTGAQFIINGSGVGSDNGRYFCIGY